MYDLITDVLLKIPVLMQLKLSGISLGSNTFIEGKNVVDMLQECIMLHKDTLEYLDLDDTKLKASQAV